MPSPDVQTRLAELLARMPQSDLLALREGALPSAQPFLAPYEHRAFAREATQENPFMALPLAVATPTYQAAKLAGLVGARTPPSLDQLLAGYKGIWEGLGGR